MRRPRGWPLWRMRFTLALHGRWQHVKDGGGSSRTLKLSLSPSPPSPELSAATSVWSCWSCSCTCATISATSAASNAARCISVLGNRSCANTKCVGICNRGGRKEAAPNSIVRFDLVTQSIQSGLYRLSSVERWQLRTASNRNVCTRTDYLLVFSKDQGTDNNYKINLNLHNVHATIQLLRISDAKSPDPYLRGDLENAALFPMSGPASWCFLTCMVFLDSIPKRYCVEVSNLSTKIKTCTCGAVSCK